MKCNIAMPLQHGMIGLELFALSSFCLDAAVA